MISPKASLEKRIVGQIQANPDSEEEVTARSTDHLGKNNDGVFGKPYTKGSSKWP